MILTAKIKLKDAIGSDTMVTFAADRRLRGLLRYDRTRAFVCIVSRATGHALAILPVAHAIVTAEPFGNGCVEYLLVDSRHPHQALRN